MRAHGARIATLSHNIPESRTVTLACLSVTSFSLSSTEKFERRSTQPGLTSGYDWHMQDMGRAEGDVIDTSARHTAIPSLLSYPVPL